MAKLTITDIARLASVSLATVSRVIHTPNLVSPKTRERVLDVIDKHKYVYNAVAGDLSRKKSSVIGLLIPTTRSPVFSRTILAIQENCQKRGFSVLLGNTKYDSRTEQELLRQFQERRVAGVILTGFSVGQEKAVFELVRANLPCVVIWEKLNEININYVGFDNFRAAFTMTEYLIGLGHERIGLIIGPYSKVGRVRKRLEGYRAALAAHGLQEDGALVVEKEPTLSDGQEAMAELLTISPRPTAVFAASDVLAIGALKAANDKGFQVPRDISLAGFDDIDFAAYCRPPLTTVRVPAKEMGHLAVNIISEAIEKDSYPVKRHCLSTELIIRCSCKEL